MSALYRHFLGAGSFLRTNPLFVIARFEFFENIRSRWLLIFGFSFFVFSNLIVYMSGDNFRQAGGSLLGLVLMLVPLFALVFGGVSFTESLPFLELLAAQPIRRRDIFLGKWFGLGTGLATSYVLGLGAGTLPRLGPGGAGAGGFLLLLGLGIVLSFVFVSFAFFIANLARRREIVFGLLLAAWFYFFVLHDLFLLGLAVQFGEYPLEVPLLVLIALNPVDLARVLFLIHQDMSAMMGYSAAIFQKSLGGGIGLLFGFGLLLAWVPLPLLAGLRIFAKRNL